MVESTTSPLLIAGAALVGVLTVVLVETLQRTGLVKEDAAIGLVFPLLFSIGVILISRYADDVHLDIDAVLLGELAFAPFDRVEAFGWDWGPKGLWVMGTILVANLLLVWLFFKELKLATFDPALAAALGLAPAAIHYGLMTSVSITAVGAFDAVGSILRRRPDDRPARRRLPANRRPEADARPEHGHRRALSRGGVLGGALAGRFDRRGDGVDGGVVFVGVLVLSPERGLIAKALRRSASASSSPKPCWPSTS